MCGICGIIKRAGGINLRNLLLGIEHRGRDATGIAYFNSHNGIEVEKNNIPASQFVSTLSNNIPCKIAMGHTRLATNGTPLFKPNNHPVMEKETGLVLIHNGIVDAPLHARNRIQDGEVDSYEIVHQIADRYKNGKNIVDSIISACEEDIQGMYACALMCPTSPDKIYLFKDGNPIFLGQSQDGEEIRFASTVQALGSDDVFWTHEVSDGKLLEIDEDGSITIHDFTPKTGSYYNNHYDWGSYSYRGESDIKKGGNEEEVKEFMREFNNNFDLGFRRSNKRKDCWVRKNGDTISFKGNDIYETTVFSNNKRRQEILEDTLWEFQSNFLELSQNNDKDIENEWDNYHPFG